MWTTATRELSFNGTVRYPNPTPGDPPIPLPGVTVDIYGIRGDDTKGYSFLRLNSLSAMTDTSGNFSFSNVPVEVLVRTVTPGGSPGLPVEIVASESLPTLAFFISTRAGEEIIEVFDERLIVDEPWLSAHPDRQNVPLTGSPSITVDIPDLVSTTTVPGNQFHFLRVGRVTRDEIGEVTDPKPGYMNSASPSFFPGIVDAPFGGTLQIGGHFGPNLLNMGDNIYYSVWFSPYSGNPTAPFDPGNKTQVLAPLFNKRYILPTSPGSPGTWQSMNLGPFNAQVSGTDVQVYQRPPLYDPLVEYYPYHDLMVIWNTKDADSVLEATPAADDLAIIAIEVYEKTGEIGGVPQLTPITLTASVNDHLPLKIDNHPPVPKFNSKPAPWETGFTTGYATFTPTEGVAGTTIAAMDPCGEVPVTGGHTDGNECIMVDYSVEDGSGNAHKHLNSYRLYVEYSPRQVAGAPVSDLVELKETFSGYDDIAGSYTNTLATAPIYSVQDYRSVLVPQDLDKWPPEPLGDPPSPCTQYAVEISLGCTVRTINGWSRIFHWGHLSRHVIIKRS